MPALQVRDFPQELYEELRSYAAAHHRIHGTEELPAAPLTNSSARLEKRDQILQRAAQRRRSRWQDLPLPVEMIGAVRAERDDDLDRIAQEYLVPAR